MTALPLTTTELDQLNDLIRRGARHLTPTERGRVLRLWEHHQADAAHAHRSAVGQQTASHRLRQQLVETRAESVRHRAAWQSARARAARNTEAASTSPTD